MVSGVQLTSYVLLALLRVIGVQPLEETAQEHSMIRQIINIKLVHIMAIFAFVYVGAEVTIGEFRVPIPCCQVYSF